MTTVLTTPLAIVITPAETTETRWTVQERAWKQDLPDLPDDVIALLAPPVVVSASSTGRTSGRAVPHAVAPVA